jgi:hypothetical protein
MTLDYFDLKPTDNVCGTAKLKKIHYSPVMLLSGNISLDFQSGRVNAAPISN